MHIDKNEYDQTDWFDWKRIRNDDKERYHPALKQAVNDWATSQIYDDLKEYCQRPDAKDEVIAKMAKSLVCHNLNIHQRFRIPKSNSTLSD